MKRIISLILIITILLSISCCKEDTKVENKEVTVLATGSAMFPIEILKIYQKDNGSKINYSMKGQRAGSDAIAEKSVHFIGTYEMDNQNFNEEMIQIPIMICGVSILYNIKDEANRREDCQKQHLNEADLYLTRDILADIFLGKITNWRDEKIKNLNKNLELPENDFLLITQGASFSNRYLTQYLSGNEVFRGRGNISNRPNWGNHKNIDGSRRSSGYCSLVSGYNGTIGYASYADWGLPCASIKNKSGIFVKYSKESLTNAARMVLPDDLSVSLIDTDNKDGYPIASFFWLKTYKELNFVKKQEAENMVNFFWWMIHEGQKHLEIYDNFAPIPENVVTKAEKLIKLLSYNGESLMK